MDVINSRPPRTRAPWDPSVCHHPIRPSAAGDFCPALRAEGGGTPHQETWSGHSSRAMQERTKTLSIRAIFTMSFFFGGKKSPLSLIILPLKEKRKLNSQAAVQNLLVHSSPPVGSSGRSLTGTGTPARWYRTLRPIGSREGGDRSNWALSSPLLGLTAEAESVPTQTSHFPGSGHRPAGGLRQGGSEAQNASHPAPSLD